ncbi:acetyl-CoA C-acetyltransferase [Pseudovibrio exalbescens]|uniref:acetyl-CoA C-acetyltransferase n=1 Tax=Pseudovibrio exalbescens TaxID=197461 RepID=UPI002366DF5B|nr:acetyl-CoA C-acetyltransferase [Pseudovibrio exalbescens]MDD7909626.1 acetyl-CoA C-acetyltransferase [Pseudovibrio exalbescens]
MTKIFIVGAKRTALGSFLGSLATVPAAKLAATAISSALEQSRVAPDQVDEVIVGNVLSANQGMGPGRQAAIYAGIPDRIPAYTLNMICGSGMKSIMEAAAHIKAGDASIVVAAGMENMSQAPFALPGASRQGHKMGTQNLADTMIVDGLTDVFHGYHMGITAENLADKFELTREAQDAFALRSQQKASSAVEAGLFDAEIAPIEVKVRRNTFVFARDEYPRADASLESLAKLKPAFKTDGSVTAGNASGINDGGVALVLASEEAVVSFGLEPLAEIVSYGQGGVAPAVMGYGPVPAIAQALERADMRLEEMERLELNEAFAAQALAVMKGLCVDHDVSMDWFEDKTNVTGGAIALGHPLGASGGRIVTTLLYGMMRDNCTHGLASLCIGGGMGTAVVLRKP